MAVGAKLATGGAVDLFDLFDQLLRWGRALANRLDDRVAGAGRYERTTVIEAAHAAIVMAGFHDAVHHVATTPGTRLNAFRVSGGRPSRLVGGETAPSGADPVEATLNLELPLPAAGQALETVEQRLTDIYYLMAAELADLVDAPDAEARTVSDRALASYRALCRQAAVDVPEVALWLANISDAATRELIRDLGDTVIGASARIETGLEGVAELVRQLTAGGTAADRRRAELARFYERKVARPVLPIGGRNGGSDLPSLGQLFINPRVGWRQATRAR